jgi:hypothetical protein
MAADDDRRHTDETREALMAGLAGAASDMSQAAIDLNRGLRDLLKAAALTRVQRWVVGAVLAVGTLGAVSASIDGVFLIHGQDQSRQILRAIKDCTDQHGKCAQQGAKTTGTAIASLNTFTLLVAECADEAIDLPRAERSASIVTCVTAKAKAQGLVK